jgi:hypothetical protein
LGSFDGLAVKADSLDELFDGEVDGDSVTGALLGLADGESVTGAILVGVPVTVSPFVGLMVVGSRITTIGLLVGATVTKAAQSFFTLSRQI